MVPTPDGVGSGALQPAGFWICLHLRLSFRSPVHRFSCAPAEGTLCSLQCGIVGWGKQLEESNCSSCWAEERPADVADNVA